MKHRRRMLKRLLRRATSRAMRPAERKPGSLRGMSVVQASARSVTGNAGLRSVVRLLPYPYNR